nr:MAG TPA: hypothetical protein [Caudoviricetes sp.]
MTSPRDVISDAEKSTCPFSFLEKVCRPIPIRLATSAMENPRSAIASRMISPMVSTVFSLSSMSRIGDRSKYVPNTGQMQALETRRVAK